jgi:hypothetical protein
MAVRKGSVEAVHGSVVFCDYISQLYSVFLDTEQVTEELDMLSLTSDGQALTLDAKWLQQLQGQVGGEGQSLHKSNPDQVPPHMDSVLEGLYGSYLIGKVSVVPAAVVTSLTPAALLAATPLPVALSTMLY